MSDYDSEFRQGYKDATYKGDVDPRAASEGRYARARDTAMHEEIMARYRYRPDEPQTSHENAVYREVASTPSSEISPLWGRLFRILVFTFCIVWAVLSLFYILSVFKVI